MDQEVQKSDHRIPDPEALRVVSVSDMYVSTASEDVLVTYSLGSCLGVSLYDPEAGVGGLIHCMMPLSRLAPDRAKEKPSMYVDTGVSRLLQTMFDRGATRKNLIAKVAGASRILDDRCLFNIGERNMIVLRKMFWKNNILIAASDVGGMATRSMFLYMDTGKTMLKLGRKIVEL